jgi:hypothetical protein
MKTTPAYLQPATISAVASLARPCSNHGSAWLAAGMSGFQGVETPQDSTTKRPTRRLPSTLT